jgi:Ribosomal protein S17
MKQTVVVSSNRQYFDKFLQKHYSKPSKSLVHDPQDILVEGDVVAYGLFPPDQRAERVKRGKKNIKYVLRDVITPFGLPLEQRTPRVTTPNPARPAGKFGKQRKTAGVRGYATVSQMHLKGVWAFSQTCSTE